MDFLWALQVCSMSDGSRTKDFDGLHLGIINRDNKHLFAHELLHNCWTTLANSRTSFSSYWTTYRQTCLFTANSGDEDDYNHLKDFFQKKSSYNLFLDACFDWKTLLQVDLEAIFACECHVLNKLLKILLYDNGCNLEEAICNRDATLLRELIIKIDEFHFSKNKGGHKCCSPYFCSSSSASLADANTSYMEQTNSVLVHAKTIAPFLSQPRFIVYLETCCMFYNISKQQKNAEKRASGVQPVRDVAVKQCDAVCLAIKRKHACVQLPHEKPVVINGQPPIIGINTVGRMMIPYLATRQVLTALLSKAGAPQEDAELYLHNAEHIHSALIPYIKFEQHSVPGRVRLADDMVWLKPTLLHWASNACELQHIPVPAIPAVKKIIQGVKLNPGELQNIRMYAPGIKALLAHDPHAAPQKEGVTLSQQLKVLLEACTLLCENILRSGASDHLDPPHVGWTKFERKIRTATISPNHPEKRAYPSFEADRKLSQQDASKQGCSKFATFSRNLMPGLFVVVCVGCGKIEYVQMMPSHESPLTAYKAMYLRDWS
jgi:hypothetical protein